MARKLNRVWHVIYPPPFGGLPHLAVKIDPDGSVEMKPFRSITAAAITS
jgi:hypothetical protein